MPLWNRAGRFAVRAFVFFRSHASSAYVRAAAAVGLGQLGEHAASAGLRLAKFIEDEDSESAPSKPADIRTLCLTSSAG